MSFLMDFNGILLTCVFELQVVAVLHMLVSAFNSRGRSYPIFLVDFTRAF